MNASFLLKSVMKVVQLDVTKRDLATAALKSAILDAKDLQIMIVCRYFGATDFSFSCRKIRKLLLSYQQQQV